MISRSTPSKIPVKIFAMLQIWICWRYLYNSTSAFSNDLYKSSELAKRSLDTCNYLISSERCTAPCNSRREITLFGKCIRQSRPLNRRPLNPPPLSIIIHTVGWLFCFESQCIASRFGLSIVTRTVSAATDCPLIFAATEEDCCNGNFLLFTIIIVADPEMPFDYCHHLTHSILLLDRMRPMRLTVPSSGSIRSQ